MPLNSDNIFHYFFVEITSIVYCIRVDCRRSCTKYMFVRGSPGIIDHDLHLYSFSLCCRMSLGQTFLFGLRSLFETNLGTEEKKRKSTKPHNL